MAESKSDRKFKKLDVVGGVPTLVLNTGSPFPAIGLGTWKSEPGVVGKAVEAAVEAGYRAIDCAAVYGNEAEIGQALKRLFEKGTVRREELFITSKLWNTNHSREHVRPALEQTLKDLQLDYIDLYLIHWPVAFEHTGIPPSNAVPKDAENLPKFAKVPIRETWEALEEVHKSGLARQIGVSNFDVVGLLDLLSYAKVTPAVNQVEMHPYLARTPLVDFCHRHGIHVTAYSQFGSDTSGAKSPLNDDVVRDIAIKHKRTPAQVILRWLLQRDISVIPKSVRDSRIKENLDVTAFSLDDADMKRLAMLDRNERLISMAMYWGIELYP